MTTIMTALIAVRVTPELKAAVQARAQELLIRESDLVRFALMAAVQDKKLAEMLERFDQVRVNKPWRVEYKNAGVEDNDGIAKGGAGNVQAS